MVKRSVQALCLLANIWHAVQASPIPEDHTVKTSSGIAQSFVDPEYPNVLQFLGIPYGVAPVGDLRFSPPQRYTGDSRLNTTSTPPACPQINSTLPTIWSESTPQFLNQAAWSEDCLSLSVWSPAMASNSTTKLPVIIFIHGGGLVSGSSSVPYQVPQPWVERSQSHIVVNIQYRLGIFGFPNAAGLNTTNLGILDQRMAIEWVRDNIDAFGGDPAKISLWGQSAGSASIDAHNFAYRDDPIATAFIQDSGTAIIPMGGGFGLFTEDPNHSNFTLVADKLSCPADPQGQIKCMRDLPASSIIEYIANYTNSNTQPPLFFIGTPDGRIVFSDYPERYKQGLLSNVPVLLGTNTMEGELFAPFPSNPQTTPANQTMANAVTLALFQCPGYQTSRLRAATGRKTYRYIYAGNFTDVSPLFWEGAYHAAELPQIFGTRGQFRGLASSYEVRTSQAMQDLWLGFAQLPSSPEAFGWKETSTGKVLRLAAADSAESYPVQIIDASVIDSPCQQTEKM